MKSDEYTTKKGDEGRTMQTADVMPTDKEEIKKAWKKVKRVPGFGVLTGLFSMGVMGGVIYKLYMKSGIHEWMFEGLSEIEVAQLEQTSNSAVEVMATEGIFILIAFAVVVGLLVMAFKIGFSWSTEI